MATPHSPFVAAPGARPARLRPARAMLTGAVLALFCVGVPAQAEMVTRFGSSMAQACYQAAKRHIPDPDGLADCNTALNEEALDTGDRAATFVNRGILRVLANDYDGALKDYNESLRLSPELGDGFVNRGLLYLRQGGKSQLAVDEITKGLDLGTRDEAIARYGLGIALEELGRLTDAYRAYARAAELKPYWDAPKKELARFTLTPKPQSP